MNKRKNDDEEEEGVKNITYSTATTNLMVSKKQNKMSNKINKSVTNCRHTRSHL